MRKWLKYTLIGVVAAVTVVFTTAALKRDTKLGQNIEILVNMFRDLSLFYVDDIDNDALLRGAAAGMTAALDPYTELISADNMSQFELMTTGKYGGIGALIRADSDYVRVAEPYEGSPAARAGLVIGDKFVAVDGRDLRGASTATVSNLLKGDPGTTVKLTVKKFYTGETVRINIKRERIALPAIPYYGMLPDSVGYIYHSDFTDGCYDEMRRAVSSLTASGAKALVLDYRGNGGGIVQEAVRILSLFLPNGTEVLDMRGRGAGSSKTFKTDGVPIAPDIPIVVLVDSYTASAAEILTGALQDLDRAVVIGTRTFGKGLVQSTRPMGYDSYLKLTTAKYYTPSGRCIQSFDYSEGRHNGGAHIADSLITEYHTKAGRKVYDGGGIMPDVKVVPQYMSRFAMTLYAKGLIDDYADKYCYSHRDNIDFDKFRISGGDYADFVKFIGDRDLKYESESAVALRALKQCADSEGYSAVDAELASISKKLNENNASLLERNKAEISDLIEDAIVLRKGYARAVARHKILTDTDVERAAALGLNRSEYRRILTSQDTSRD